MIDVYVNGGGESDWYGILGVDRFADDVALKKHYKKLALLLHPDKNKFSGAEGAFNSCLRCLRLSPTANSNSTTSEEAERLFKSRMKRRADENSTSEAERLFKKPAVVFASEAERLFKIPVPRADPKSTCEAERLFKNPITQAANANCNSEAQRLFGNKPMNAGFFSFTS
ncbi:hypothetical protein Bca101_013125 [Brassica carinata]